MHNLYGGAGDPGSMELNTALQAYTLMKELGLPVRYEKNVKDILGGENKYDHDFLSGE